MIQGQIMSKNIVLCCDGTGNEYGDANTNVLRLYSLLEKDESQRTFYSPGVGTLSAPTIWSKIGEKASKAAGLAVGAGIIRDIEDAYAFLMNHYEDGDRIFIYGFSRGAFTARAIAALIAKCGMLNRGNDNLVPYATKVFRYEMRPEIYRGFRKAFSRRCRIHFLGLWDTVKSVGWVYDPISFQFTANNPIVRTVRHAISIDERRTFYRQNLWSEGRQYQSIKQVWFAGVHSDVGGGYPVSEGGPANIALDWMIKQSLPDLKINGKQLARMLPPAELSVEQPLIHESLVGLWRLAEYLPRSYLDPANNWKKRWKIYRGERRTIEEGSLVHQSVFDRMTLGAYSPNNLPVTYDIEPW